MGKLTGIALVLLGCAGLVLSWSAAQKKRQELAAELIRLLAGWEYSLERKRMRASEYFSQFTSAQAEVQLLIEDLVRALDAREYKSGALLWRRVLEKNRCRLDPGREVWELFLSADGVFFGTSSVESLRCARVCRAHMEECLVKDRAEHVKKQKVYAPLGLLGGVLIIILLI